MVARLSGFDTTFTSVSLSTFDPTTGLLLFDAGNASLRTSDCNFNLIFNQQWPNCPLGPFTAVVRTRILEKMYIGFSSIEWLTPMAAPSSGPILVYASNQVSNNNLFCVL